jgi:hypothetical protein
MKLKRLAQSTVLLTQKTGHTLLVDPGKYNIEPGRLSVGSFPRSHVLVITHKHADHFDVELVKAIVAEARPVILTNPEIAAVLNQEDIPSTVLNEDASAKLDPTAKRCTAAGTAWLYHDSSPLLRVITEYVYRPVQGGHDYVHVAVTVDVAESRRPASVAPGEHPPGVASALEAPSSPFEQ